MRIELQAAHSGERILPGKIPCSTLIVFTFVIDRAGQGYTQQTLEKLEKVLGDFSACESAIETKTAEQEARGTLQLTAGDMTAA